MLIVIFHCNLNLMANNLSNGPVTDLLDSHFARRKFQCCLDLNRIQPHWATEGSSSQLLHSQLLHSCRIAVPNWCFAHSKKIYTRITSLPSLNQERKKINWIKINETKKESRNKIRKLIILSNKTFQARYFSLSILNDVWCLCCQKLKNDSRIRIRNDLVLVYFLTTYFCKEEVYVFSS